MLRMGNYGLSRACRASDLPPPGAPEAKSSTAAFAQPCVCRGISEQASPLPSTATVARAAFRLSATA